MKRSILWVLAALIALIGWCGVPREATRGTIDHGSLHEIRIYAYRDWQSTGVRVHPDDLVTVEAAGTWLYTPGEYHGPEGHDIYLAPRFYPLPNVRGGALIGRIGEEGDVFHVGRSSRWRAREEGFLYLRIDDDILSDNKGYVTVEVEVEVESTGQ
jgi:hypothetical protein